MITSPGRVKADGDAGPHSLALNAKTLAKPQISQKLEICLKYVSKLVIKLKNMSNLAKKC